MDKMFFLIDTNIFIQLEDNQVVKESFAKFHKLCSENFSVICIHKLSKEEIEKDNDQKRKDNSLSKIEKYKLLEQPPLGTKEELEAFFGEIRGRNDEIDCQLLFALQKDAVHFLVTEDTGIHKRAKMTGLRNKVLTVSQANNMLERLFPKPKEVSLPKITKSHVYCINRDDKIFDSLKYEYPDFEDWIRKCSKEHVKAWIVKNSKNDKLESICIYKESKKEDYFSYNLSKKSLKLATFKVDEFYRGKKLGELMLKQAFLYAMKNNYKSCWMTVFPKHEILIDFIKDFGFIEIGKTKLRDKETNKRELVFQKKFIRPRQSSSKGLNFHIKYSPFYDDGRSIGKYIIPIKKRYHEILFPEYETLFPAEQLSFPGMKMVGIPGNTIKKVYLCHSSMKKIEQNDLLFFYVSKPIQEIRSIGIVESVFRSNDLNKVISHIGKRSVYSFSEIKEMTQKKMLVIEFRFIKHLELISFETLKKEGILLGPPQSIMELKNYCQIKKIIGENH